jgi:hypothetical protein
VWYGDTYRNKIRLSFLIGKFAYPFELAQKIPRYVTLRYRNICRVYSKLAYETCKCPFLPPLGLLYGRIPRVRVQIACQTPLLSLAGWNGKGPNCDYRERKGGFFDATDARISQISRVHKTPMPCLAQKTRLRKGRNVITYHFPLLSIHTFPLLTLLGPLLRMLGLYLNYT